MGLRRGIILAALCCAAPHDRLVAQIQRINIGHSATKDVEVRLQGPFAQLSVIGWTLDSVSITGTLPSTFKLDNVFAGDQNAPSRSAKMYIDGSGVIMPKMAWLELHVPMQARVSIKGGTAQLSVTGVNGDLDLNMIGGTISVDAKPKALNVEAMDANVSFSGVADWLRLKTDAGDIVMHGQSPDAAFTTVSGNVRVLDATLDRARFESATGSLTFGGELARGASLTFDTHSGPIDLQLGGKPDVAIEAVTMMGSIENLLSASRPVPGHNGRGQELDFELARGSGRIRIQTYKGTVRISGR